MLRFAFFKEVPKLSLTIILALIKFSLINYFSLIGYYSSKTMELSLFDRTNVAKEIIDRDGVIFLEIEI